MKKDEKVFLIKILFAFFFVGMLWLVSFIASFETAVFVALASIYSETAFGRYHE